MRAVAAWALAARAFLSLGLCAPAHGFTATFGELSVTWAPPAGGLVTLNVSYSGSADGAWFAVGASSSSGMVGGDVLLCQPGLAAVSQAVLSATSRSGVSAASPSPLLATAGCASGSATSFSATRAVAAGSYAGALALTGDLRIIWAVGPAGSGSALPEHHSEGVGTLNLVTGASSSAATLTLQAHGVLMFAAWGALAPLGVLAARYGKRLRPGPPPLWYTAHRAVQIVAACQRIDQLIDRLPEVSDSEEAQLERIAALQQRDQGLGLTLRAELAAAQAQRSCWGGPRRPASPDASWQQKSEQKFKFTVRRPSVAWQAGTSAERGSHFLTG